MFRVGKEKFINRITVTHRQDGFHALVGHENGQVVLQNPYDSVDEAYNQAGMYTDSLCHTNWE